MISQKSHSLKLFLWKNIFVIGVGFCAAFLGLSINTSEASALFTPTLSASIDNTAALINGNQVINSTSKTTEIPLNLTVNTNNKTGYTATLNSETDETALVNNGSTNNAKINSISSTGLLGDFSNNTWGYKFGTSANYAPIPALSTPAQILQTTGKTNGNESNQLSIGMKLSDNLENGRYTNKLIFSILTNNYEDIAIMTEGPDFNTKLKALETATSKIERFKKSTVAPVASMSAVNIEDEDSDYEIKLWLDPTDKTAYYYAEPEKVYLNTDSSKMFYSEYGEQKIKNILELDVSNFDTSKVTNMQYMFIFMSNLTTLDVSNFNTSKVTSMEGMFLGMSNLTTLDLSNFNTSKVTNMNDMFSGMSNLNALNLFNFDTSQVTDMGGMFRNMSNLITLNLSSFDTSKVTNMNSTFSGMVSLTSLNLSNFNTSKVIRMDYMFQDMSNLITLNLSSFDTSKVTNMGFMFYNMSNLTSLNLSNFNAYQVTNMEYMFARMSNLTNLQLSESFDTSNVSSMRYMFYKDSKLTSLDLSSFNTKNVTNMDSMFSYLFSITDLNLSTFNTQKVTNMNGMFYNLEKVKTLDLSTFDTSRVKNMTEMFALMDFAPDNLEKIYVSNSFSTDSLINSSTMFRNRKKLRGGAGSFLADPSTADKTWLRIDDPTNGHPGYFTRKP